MIEELIIEGDFNIMIEKHFFVEDDIQARESLKKYPLMLRIWARIIYFFIGGSK